MVPAKQLSLQHGAEKGEGVERTPRGPKRRKGEARGATRGWMKPRARASRQRERREKKEKQEVDCGERVRGHPSVYYAYKPVRTSAPEATIAINLCRLSRILLMPQSGSLQSNSSPVAVPTRYGPNYHQVGLNITGIVSPSQGTSWL